MSVCYLAEDQYISAMYQFHSCIVKVKSWMCALISIYGKYNGFYHFTHPHTATLSHIQSHAPKKCSKQSHLPKYVF